MLSPGKGHRAFSAGGDMAAVFRIIDSNSPQYELAEYSKAREYLIHNKFAESKAFTIAIWDGIVMGSGVGISIHSDARIATSKSMFAMPEAVLGVFTDVGASYFFPRIVNNEICFGLYLALTGNRIKGKDLVKWGLATHYVPEENLEPLKQAIVDKVQKGMKDE